MTSDRIHGRYFSIARGTLDTVVQKSGLPTERVRELCVDCESPDPEHQLWLDSSEPARIARWVRRTDDFVRYPEENW